MPWLVGHRSWWQCTDPSLTPPKLSSPLASPTVSALIRDETGGQESQQTKAVSLEPQEGIKDTTKQTQKTENINLCTASCWGGALRIRLELPPPQSQSLCQASAGHVGMASGGQPVSPAHVPSPRRAPCRWQLACRLLVFPQLWPGVPAHVALEGREQQLGTGEPPTHARTLPPAASPWHGIPDPCQPLVPPWQEGSASLLSPPPFSGIMAAAQQS